MKNLLNASLILMVFISLGCNKEEAAPTAAELVAGQQTIDSSEVLGTVVSGDGSYLRFQACSSACIGVDYKVSDTTSGTFNYTINEEATILAIIDNSSDGGSWSGEWDILELTESDLRITTTTIFGSMKVEMSK